MPNAKPVFEINSIGLIKMASEIKNEEREFFCGGVLNFSDNLSGLEKVLQKKKESGASFIIS